MIKEFWENLGLTEKEIKTFNAVNDAARLSQQVHTRGGEVKEIDLLTAKVANSVAFRSAWDKIHQAEVQSSEIDY